MGGEQTNSESGKNVENPDKTGKVNAEGPEEVEAGCPADVPAPAASRMVVLEAIVRGIKSPQERWPGEVLKAAIGRFGRMPNGGWHLCHSLFCELFKCTTPLSGFKKRANSAIVSNAGNRCSRKRFAEESVKRVKTIDMHFDESTLHEAKVYSDLKRKYEVRMQEISEREIDQAKWTRKVSSEAIDPLILGAINQAAGEYAAQHPPVSMSDIARQLQAAQECYSEATEKPKVVSEWRSSIEKKIQGNLDSKALLERALAGEKLTPKELSEARLCMRNLNLVLAHKRDTQSAISILEERARVYASKLKSQESRRDFRYQNRSFELFRKRFYRRLSGEGPVEHDVKQEDIKAFWSTMWNRREVDSSTYDEYLEEFIPECDVQDAFPSAVEFGEIIRILPSWKAAGPDGVYNFFIKECKSLHGYMYEIVRKICLEGKEQAPWFYKGITYLIPKGVPSKGSDFRPITCMSNLYKLTTKCVARVMQIDVVRRGLLAENQMGTVAYVQGAKEQALLNIAVNRDHKNQLKTAWFDVKKAFDSVDHSYLLKRIERLDMPAWVSRFLRSITSNWRIDIRSGGESIMEKGVERGILQGDSLSPLLFVLCMDPLSRRLNMRYPMVSVGTEHGMHTTNHLLFIDDLKLLALNDDDLAAMSAETQEFFGVVGLEINRDKSATNSVGCADAATLLEGAQGYKYLGIIEDSTSRPTQESFEKVKAELLGRVERLCKTKLNGKNLMKGLNEHAVSLVNYYIGLLRLEPADFCALDHSIRQLLNKYGIHQQPACLERLYLPRTELGRGLHNVEFKSEQMLLQLHNYLAESAPVSTRTAAILKLECDENTHLGTITAYVKAKYNLATDPSAKSLSEAQKARLYSEIEKKTRHEKLYRVRSNELSSLADSSVWLKHGNIRPQDEARYCALQDRNMFGGERTLCPHCRTRPKTVEHLATQCDRMLYYDYMRRHNEVVRCIHLGLCTKYGLKAFPRMRSHSVQEVVANENVVIRVDTRVRTAIKINENRPDIFVHDKKRHEVILIEVGITSQDRLQTVEAEKMRKYDLLANKLGTELGCKARIIPYVMTWDGVVSNYHKRYSRDIGISESVEAYIQTIVLKRTLESISLEHRRGACQDDAEETSVRLSAGQEGAGIPHSYPEPPIRV